SASVITLSYTDEESDEATECVLSNLNNITETAVCSCDNGVCEVEVTGIANYAGAASFTYTVTAGGKVSNSATATLTINQVDDAPVASDITPPSFAEDTESIITLNYTDIENHE